MSEKKDSLDISNKEYYDILSRGLKVTRSISKKAPDKEEKSQFREAQVKEIGAKNTKRK
jgi:hypothetical protein